MNEKKPLMRPVVGGCGLLLALLGLTVQAAETALARYVARPDPHYAYHLYHTQDRAAYAIYFLEMTSQQWRSAMKLFNEIESDIDIKAGTPIFLETKKQKSAAGIEVHVVQAGQSLFEIAQKYGMKLKTLCKNDMNPGYLAKEGTILKLR